MTEHLPLVTKYRPSDFETFLGNETIIAALKRAVGNEVSRPHAFLFTGPSGIGKTTGARIVATMLNAEVVEIDAASNNGVDAMRLLVELGNHMSLTGAGVRMFIIDECFARGTRVFTPSGPRSIESIRAGDYITGALGPARVKRAIKTSVELTRILRLRLESGDAILCSEDHAFLSEKGWIPAKKAINAKRISTTSSNISREMLRLWDADYEHGRRSRTALCSMLAASFAQNLSRVWDGVLFRNAYVLAQLRQQDSGPQTAGAAPAGVEGFDGSCSGATRDFSEGQRDRRAIFQTDARAQSYAKSREYHKNDGDEAHERDASSQESLAGRKWARSLIRAIKALRRGRRSDGVHRTDAWATEGASLSVCLQDRLGIPTSDASNRDRWAGSSEARDAGAGSQERLLPSDARVESAAYLQPADIERLRRNGETRFVNGVECANFYDLEIEDHPSYNVEGLIVHNCHSLSKSAWQAILKMLEEPPAHLYIALCTTELHKVPETIVTRCYHVALRPLKPAEIEDLCMVVAELEGWTVHNDVTQAVVQAATGQPRKALSILQAVHDAPSRDEVRRIITLMDATDPLIALLQYLLAGKKAWAIIKGHLSRIEEDDFEEISIGAGRYIVGALLRAETDSSAQLAWRLLDALVFPTSTFDRKASFMAAIGRMIWGNN